MPQFPRFTFDAAEPTPHTRIGWNTLAAKIALPPLQASGNFRALPHSPQFPGLRHLPARDARNHLIGKRISRECQLGAWFWQKRGPIAVAIAQTILLPREFSFQAVRNRPSEPMRRRRSDLRRKNVERVALATDAPRALRGAHQAS
jgi:hypothetical protein